MGSRWVGAAAGHLRRSGARRSAAAFEAVSPPPLHSVRTQQAVRLGTATKTPGAGGMRCSAGTCKLAWVQPRTTLHIREHAQRVRPLPPVTG